MKKGMKLEVTIYDLQLHGQIENINKFLTDKFGVFKIVLFLPLLMQHSNLENLLLIPNSDSN